MGWISNLRDAWSYGDTPEGDGYDLAERQVDLWGDVGWGATSLGSVGSSGTLAGSSGIAALRLSVVYRCVNLIANQLAALPVTYWQVDPVTKLRLRQLPVPGWVKRPDPGHGLMGMGWQDIIVQMVTSLLLNGNAYVAYACSQPGRVRELAVLDPAQVDVEVRSDGTHVLKVNGRVPEYPVLPIRYVVPPGFVLGISPIAACHRRFVVAEGAQEQSAGFYTRGATLPGQIRFEGELTDEQLKKVANRWNRQMAGVGKAHLPLFLQEAEFKPIGLSPQDAQTLETWEWSDATIASHIFGVDPAMVGAAQHGDKNVYANIGQRNRYLWETAMVPVARRLEQCFDMLCPANGRYELRFDIRAFVADDARTRYHTYKVGIDAGVLTRNEARAEEGMPPIEGDGDDVPPQMRPPDADDGDDETDAGEPSEGRALIPYLRQATLDL